MYVYQYYSVYPTTMYVCVSVLIVYSYYYVRMYVGTIVYSYYYGSVSITCSPTIHVCCRALFAIGSDNADIDGVSNCAFADADSTIIVDFNHFIGAVIFSIKLCFDVS